MCYKIKVSHCYASSDSWWTAYARHSSYPHSTVDGVHNIRYMTYKILLHAIKSIQIYIQNANISDYFYSVSLCHNMTHKYLSLS